ncbi:MAG: HAD family hydrolase [Brevinematales bacterium]|jgi:putative hydrolase of the HAD superfamily
MITDLIFDFFGTLVEYNETRDIGDNSSSYDYLKSIGFNIPARDYIEAFDKCFIELEKKSIQNKTEFHMLELGRLFFKKHFDTRIDDDTNKVFVQKYIDDWNRNTIYYPNILDFVDNINKKYRVSILSNTHYPNLIYNNLDNMRVRNYFYKIYTSVEIGIRKPNKEIFEHVLNDLNISENNAVYIGDNYNDDYLGAKTVNMDCYLIDKLNKYKELGAYSIAGLFELTDKI